MIHVSSMSLITKTTLGKSYIRTIARSRYNGNRGSKHISIPLNNNVISFITSWSNQQDKADHRDVNILNFVNLSPKRFSSSSSSNTSKHDNSLNEGIDVNDKAKDIDTAEIRQELTEKGMTHAKQGMSKVKILMAKYGYFFVGTYLSVYIGTVYTLYFLIDNGLVDPSSLSIPNWFPFAHSSEDEDATLVSIIADLADNFEFTKKYVDSIKKRPEFVNLGIAWVATKFTEPIRLGVSIFLTPKIARLFGREEKD